MLHWTTSRDGIVRATLRLEIRVRKDIWDWLRENVSRSVMNDQQLLDWWRDQIQYTGTLAAESLTLIVWTNGKPGTAEQGDDLPAGVKRCPLGMY